MLLWLSRFGGRDSSITLMVSILTACATHLHFCTCPFVEPELQVSQELRQEMLTVASGVITVDGDTGDTEESQIFQLSTATLVVSLLGEVRVLYDDKMEPSGVVQVKKNKIIYCVHFRMRRIRGIIHLTCCRSVSSLSRGQTRTHARTSFRAV